MKKMKRIIPKPVAPSYKLHVCNGCGYEYNPEFGDEDGEVNQELYLKFTGRMDLS